MNEWMELQINRLQDTNIVFEIVPNREHELEIRWEDAFTKGISKSQKRKMAFKQSMWNVFSWEKIECLKEQQAIDAFNQQKKKGCYLINASAKEAIYVSKAGRIKAKDIIQTGSPFGGSENVDDVQQGSALSLSSLMDLYIVDKEFTWTYVLPHEEGCGPYFHML